MVLVFDGARRKEDATIDGRSTIVERIGSVLGVGEEEQKKSRGGIWRERVRKMRTPPRHKLYPSLDHHTTERIMATEVSFPSADNTSLNIYGNLTLPSRSTDDAIPAILIINGSGPIDRDGNPLPHYECHSTHPIASRSTCPSELQINQLQYFAMTNEELVRV